jgi:hypothetical protein
LVLPLASATACCASRLTSSNITLDAGDPGRKSRVPKLCAGLSEGLLQSGNWILMGLGDCTCFVKKVHKAHLVMSLEETNLSDSSLP